MIHYQLRTLRFFVELAGYSLELRAVYRELAGTYNSTYRSKDYEAESARIVEIIEEHDAGTQTLLDVACGTGGHLEHLRHRFECEGLDLSDKMLQIARAKLPDLIFYTGSMTEFDLGKSYDAVVCLFSAVGHLETVDRLNAAVRRMTAHLAPNGILIVEPWTDPADWILGHVGTDIHEDDDMRVARLLAADPLERGRVVMEVLVGARAGVTRLRGEHEMSWFTRAEYEKSFEDAGLSARFEAKGLTGRGLYIGHFAP